MIIYGIMTETSIGKLFAPAVLPGLLARRCSALRSATSRGAIRKAGPAGERTSWRERLSAIKDVWAVAALFIIVMGGIYGGIFTATEGAGIGAFGAFCFALVRRVLDLKTLLQILADSARTTAMLFMILVGALVFANFVNYTTMPADLKGFVDPLRDQPDHRDDRDLRDLRDPRHRDGRAVDDSADGAGLLPARRPPRLRSGVVRHHHRRRRDDRTDQSAGRHEHVRRQEHAAGRCDAHHLRGVTPFVVATIVLLALLVAFPSISLILPKLMKL
jgi:TRAP-type C4-dicarboxylate transport system permease large subunit